MGGMIIDGVFGSEAIDSSGEVLDVAGADISSLNDGTGILHNYDAGFLDWEHLDEKPGETKQAQKYGPLGCVGRILFARKIFKEGDCQTDRERRYWDLLKLPLIYGQVELMDADGHEQAKALAAMIRHYNDRGLPIQVKYSVEGTILARDPHDEKILRRSVIRKCAATVAACNKSALAGLVSDPNRAPALATPTGLAEPTWKSEDPGVHVFGAVTLQCMPVVTDPLSKTLTAGSYDAAPRALTGGAALQRESLGPTVEQLQSWKNQGLATVRDWDRKTPIREVLRRHLTDASPEFIDGFARMVEDFQLKKGQSRLVGDLGDYVGRSQLALGKTESDEAERARLAAVGYMEQDREAGAFSCGACAFASQGFCSHDRIQAHVSATHGCCNEFRPAEGDPVPAPEWSQGQGEPEGLDKGEPPVGDEPLTIQGQPQAALPTVHQPQFDTRRGILYTQRGAFPVYIPHRDPRGAKAFESILADPKVEAFHGEAMKNWSRLHRRLRKGKVPPEVVMHAVLFSQLSPNTPVSVQELMYGHLVDAMRATGTDTRDPKGLGALKRDWLKRDQPDTPPEHSRDYFEALPGAHLAHDSKFGDRKVGDLASFMLANEKFKNIGRYHELHDSLVDLIRRHREDARGGVEELMAHKHAAQLHEAARDRALESGRPDPGPYREGPAVPGLAPKTARYMYGMLGGGNVAVPDTHFVRHLFGLERGKDSRTISYLKDRLWEPHNTHLLNGIDQYYARHHDAVRFMVRHPRWGQAFESPDDAIFPAFWRHWISIAPHERARGQSAWAFQEATTHRPFWEAVNPYLAKAEDEAPVAARTARTHRAWANEYGDIPALFLYYRYLVPELMAADEDHEDVHKAEAVVADLRASWEDLVKAEGDKIQAVHFAGRDIIPGFARLPDGPHAVLDEDDTHLTVVPEAKASQWELGDLKRVPKNSPFITIEGRPQPVGDLTLDAHRHGLGTLGPEQVELLHGLDIGQAGARDERKYSGAAVRSRWIKGTRGPVFVKMDPPSPHRMSESHREATYYNLARDFFGMGDLVPRTAAFRHPVTGDSGAVIEGVQGQHWRPLDPKDREAMVRHGDSGLLDRVRLMDRVMGNGDRHRYNYMLTPEGDLRLIDHGLALASDATDNEIHRDYLHSALGRTPLTDELMTFNRHPLAPAAQRWVMGLKPEKLEMELMRNGVPGAVIAQTLARLNRIQTALANPSVPKTQLF